jgi:hypothetical protein
MGEQELHPYVEWIAREARRPALLDPAAKSRLMAAVRAEPRPARTPGWAWLLRARPLSLSPVGSLAVAASLVGIGVFVGLALTHRDGQPLAGQPPVVVAHAQSPVHTIHDTVRVTRFVFVAPQASRVALVGDFNRWDTGATPMMRTRASGTWSITLPLHEGRHVYAFVVNGTTWLADPAAPRAPADSYGTANSVVVVGGAAL